MNPARKKEIALTNLSAIKILTGIWGWKEINHNQHIYLISYQKDGVRLDVYYSTRTVTTSMNHPKKGKTQLHRKNVSLTEFKKLVANPRHHTGKGYYKKRKQ